MTPSGNDERGLTLVETLAALTVFAVVTVGITPLLVSSIRGSNLARSFTVAKDVALQGMERARGLPYYISYQSQTKKVDVLDIYFPCADSTLAITGCAGEGTRSYSAGIFSIICPAGVTGPTCAILLPTGYSVTYDARFVGPDGTTLVTPPTNPMYKRNPDFATEGQLDTPPSQLLELTVTARWTVAGEARSYSLMSVIGDRKFGEIKMSGVGRINYGVQVQTSYQHTLGNTRTSDLRAVLGNAEARLETRLVSTADQRVRAADITLLERVTDSDPTADDVAGPLRGVVTEFRAPPNQTPTVGATPLGEITMTHPNIAVGTTKIAALNQTTASGLAVSVANELPSSSGSFGFNAGGVLDGFVWFQNQADTTNSAVLRLDSSRKGVFSLKGSGADHLTGTTSTVSTPLGPTRKVETSATMALRLLRVMPTTFLSFKTEEERFVVLIKDFAATVNCKATGSSAATVPTGSWQAIFKFWYDSDPNNNSSTDADLKPISISISGALLDPTQGGSTAFSDMRALIATNYSGPPYDFLGSNFANGNPLVYDGLLPTDDVYLFSEPLKNGYLSSFTINPVITSEDTEGTLTTAGVDGAIHITTVPTNPLFPESGLNINVGSLRCEALDKR